MAKSDDDEDGEHWMTQFLWAALWVVIIIAMIFPKELVWNYDGTEHKFSWSMKSQEEKK